MLCVPLCTVIYQFVHNRSLRVWKILLAFVLGLGVLISLYNAFEVIFLMSLFSFGINVPGIIVSTKVAIQCIREREADELQFSSVATAVGYYLLFMMLSVFLAPKLRFCEGCMEWH